MTDVTGDRMLTLLFALLAGILTITTPCTLPVLPILLGASVGQTNSLRPVFITLGFVMSFAAAVLVFSTITEVLGIDQNTLRVLAAVSLIGFGVLMLWPSALHWFASQTAGIVSFSMPGLPNRLTGNPAGFVLGTTLGLVWTPCAGPVLASILTVIATAHAPAWGGLLLLAYAAGAAVPMLAIAYGGQIVTTRIRSVARVSYRLQQGFGLVIICFAVAMYFQYDVVATTWLSDLYPGAQPDS